MLSSAHDMTTTVMSSQLLWLSTRDQTSQSLGMDEADGLQAPWHTEELLVVDSCWGRETHSLLRMWWVCPYPRESSHPCT